jgi:indolepyruvate ferredoxin oxidoreductase
MAARWLADAGKPGGASMALLTVTLEDKYSLDAGRVFLTGTQALVRLALIQRRRDASAGLNTAGFISGYRGSPLGGLDQQIWSARRLVESHHIRFNPGVNEDLAATSVWGAQQVGLLPGAKYDGVFGMWYGKGPGVDRSGDALKHANLAGTARFGGVLALAGDDHTCKSSTTAHQSEFAFLDAMIPVLSPAGVQEFLDLGLHGWALSRFSGCWAALKCVADTVDTSASVSVDPARVEIRMPIDFEMPPGGLNIRWPDPPLEQEARLHGFKIRAAEAYARANRLDRVVFGAERPRLGIVASGKSYLDLRQALFELGIDHALASEIGLGVYKVVLAYPLEREALLGFATGLQELFVVEEKRAFIETQAKDILYHLPAERRPRLVGKSDERGAPLLTSAGELTPARIARAIADRLTPFYTSDRIRARLAGIERTEAAANADSAPIVRLPYFCSGCPHNSSTRIPDGSRALAGIGCHYMVQWMDRNTATFTQMGGEGATWIGQAPFTAEPHVFVNLGDGTYFHSGVLAIRAAVAAKVNVTYKILYNDAVAMTGGQKLDGELSVPDLATQLAGEGVAKIVVVSDQPEKYPIGINFPKGTRVAHRDALEAIQKELRAWPGVSVLIYDQTCAAEKRRRRKRGLMEDPARRVFINEAVCEGCGDCGIQSNCVSIMPVETEFGRKRQIDQSSCNKDFSCIKGFCPSFVTIEGGQLRKRRVEGPEHFVVLPEPKVPALDRNFGIYVAGIGGTGVVTIGALLGMAAHLEGRGCGILDMTGLAQKGGAVVTHIRLAPSADDIHSVRLSTGGCDLLLACDMVTASTADALAKFSPGKTHAVVNTEEAATGEFTRRPDLGFPAADIRKRLEAALGAGRADWIEASRLATALLGDSIATNLFVLGYAYQKGFLPLSGAAIEQAIRLNAVAVDANLRAFLWGRRAAHDLAATRKAASPTLGGPQARRLSTDLEETIERRASELVRYQNAAYAERYRALIQRVRKAEADRTPGRSGLTAAVARSLFKLMAYKDEYEVARLYSDPSFTAAIKANFEGDYRLNFHLAPPLLAERDPETGHLKKQSFGPWMLQAFGLLAQLRFLRGSWADPFGYTAERRAERRLVREFERTIEEVVQGLSLDNHAIAVELALVPERIRGFGHVKEANLVLADKHSAELRAAFRTPQSHRTAAE